jgi:NAD(P)-dependent dehydrogenase (short-subunit alcohol dehydrogenase family)
MSNILITGGYTGIGLATVKALLDSATKDKPLTIAITSRSLDRAESAVRDLGESHAAAFADGHKVVPYQVDLDDDESIYALVAKLEKMGKLDILINNAGKSDIRLYWSPA